MQHLDFRFVLPRSYLGWATLAMAACGPGGGGASVVGVETDPTDGPTQSTPPSNTDVATGLFLRLGVAEVDGGFDANETWRVIDDDGDGNVVCEITTTLSNTVSRDDCAACEFAWDLQRSASQVSVDGGACLASVGVDAQTVGTLDGAVVSYGYDPDYIGHRELLMVFDGTDWVPGSYATLVGTTLTWEWEDGYVPVGSTTGGF